MSEKVKNIPSDEDIKTWLNSISNGDQAAFTLLLRNFWVKVYTQALTYLKSSILAQEITQDVFIKIWSIRDKLPEIDDFSGYLFILSRNEIISTLRKKNVQTSLPVEEFEEVLLRPERQLEYKEIHHKILQLIERLPPMRKRVFSMSRIEGKTYEEIGEELGISRNGVKDHIIKALIFLRNNIRFYDETSMVLMIAAPLLV
jgi:RNA polymerase sigma-70 factor (family 1)